MPSEYNTPSGQGNVVEIDAVSGNEAARTYTLAGASGFVKIVNRDADPSVITTFTLGTTEPATLGDADGEIEPGGSELVDCEGNGSLVIKRFSRTSTDYTVTISEVR